MPCSRSCARRGRVPRLYEFLAAGGVQMVPPGLMMPLAERAPSGSNALDHASPVNAATSRPWWIPPARPRDGGILASPRRSSTP